MSLFSTTQVNCPQCGESNLVEEVGSINADRRPDLRDGIFNGTLQRIQCAQCGHSFRMEPDLNYLDAGRGQWIAAYPVSRIVDHLEAADEMIGVYEKNFGVSAGKAAHELGRSLTGRVVFGWPALREKLLIRDRDLDEVAVELLKLDLLRDMPEIPFGAGPELRLVEAEGATLVLAWFGPGIAASQRVMEVDVERYQDIVGRIGEWQGIADELTDSPFVDIKKLYLGPGRAAAVEAPPGP